MVTSDLGNTGTGPALGAGGTVNITVTPAPAPPPPPVSLTATPLVSPILPEVFVQFAKLGRSRVRLLGVTLGSPMSVPLTLLLRIPLKRTGTSRRARTVIGVLTINPGETTAEFAFRVPGNPMRDSGLHCWSGATPSRPCCINGWLLSEPLTNAE
jgi:hypothetical protein